MVLLKLTCGSRDRGKVKMQIHMMRMGEESVIIYLPAGIQRGVRAKKNTLTNTNTNTNDEDEDEGRKRRGW